MVLYIIDTFRTNNIKQLPTSNCTLQTINYCTQHKMSATHLYSLSLQLAVTFPYHPDRNAPITILTTNHITLPTTNHNATMQISKPQHSFEFPNITWLWRWLPLRIVKHQSPSTVLPNTPFTWTIKFHWSIHIKVRDPKFSKLATKLSMKYKIKNIFRVIFRHALLAKGK